MLRNQIPRTRPSCFVYAKRRTAQQRQLLFVPRAQSHEARPLRWTVERPLTAFTPFLQTTTLQNSTLIWAQEGEPDCHSSLFAFPALTARLRAIGLRSWIWICSTTRSLASTTSLTPTPPRYRSLYCAPNSYLALTYMSAAQAKGQGQGRTKVQGSCQTQGRA